MKGTLLIVPLSLHLLNDIEVEQWVPPVMLRKRDSSTGFRKLRILCELMNVLHLLTCIHIKRLVWVWIGSHLLGGQSRADKKFSTTFWSLPVLKKWQKIKSIDASEIGLGYESKYSLQHWFYISTFHDSPTSQIDIIWHFLKIAKGRQGEKVEYWLWLITWERQGRRGIVGWAPSCLWQSPVN